MLHFYLKEVYITFRIVSAKKKTKNKTVCQKPLIFFFVLSSAVIKIVKVRINAIEFIFFEADVRTFGRSKSESLRDVTVTRIGYTLFYGFPQTEKGR